MFVLPMSLAAAVTIRVGYRLGGGSTLGCRAQRTGLGVGILAWLWLPAIFTVTLRKHIAFRSGEQRVVALAAQCTARFAVYQMPTLYRVIRRRYSARL